METKSIAELVNELNDVTAQRNLALAACRSIRFANSQAVRHGGDYSLNELLAADRLAKVALDCGRDVLKKHRVQRAAKKGGRS